MDGHRMTAALDERDRTRAAMERILAGTPERSNGALTIVAVAQESRRAPQRPHPTTHRPKNEFYARAQERGAPSELEKHLRATISKLRTTIDNKNQELNKLRTDVPALVRVVNQLTLENQRLRDTLAQHHDVVIAFRGNACTSTDHVP